MVVQNSWGSIGQKVSDVETMEEAIVKNGMDYSIRKIPLYKDDGSIIPNRFGVENEQTGQVYDVVKDVWKPLQNRKCFEFVDKFIQDETIKIDRIGKLRGGEKMFVVAKINSPPMEIVKDDFVEKFIILINNHSSKFSIRVGFTPIRMWCLNQLSSIAKNEASQMVRIRHSGNVDEKLDNLREIMDTSIAAFSATEEQLKFLASKPIISKDVEKYIKNVFRIKDDEKISTRKQNILDKVIGLAETGMGNHLDNVRGTFYASYNAITQYINHDMGRSADLRMESLWLGEGSNMNDRALQTALQMAS